jgi:hypothetical protein
VKIREVKCINKSDRYNSHERILFIGGETGEGNPWKLAQQEAIKGIEECRWGFFVAKYSRNVRVVVAVSPDGHKYLKTEADGEHPNHLLNLPECPK